MLRWQGLLNSTVVSDGNEAGGQSAHDRAHDRAHDSAHDRVTLTNDKTCVEIIWPLELILSDWSHMGTVKWRGT